MSEFSNQPDVGLQKTAKEVPGLILNKIASARISELTSTAEGKWIRERQFDPCTQIRNKETGKILKIEQITDPESSELIKVQKLMEDTFTPEETDPIEYAKMGIKGENGLGEPDVKYNYYIIKEGDEILAIHAGGILSLKDDNGKETNDAVYVVGYAVTAPDEVRKGYAKELYASAVINAAHEAEEQGKKLIGVFGETTSTSELFWDSVKQRRVYAFDQEENTYTELPYFHPALEFNSDGLPEEREGESPEHLMIDLFDNDRLTKDRLLQIVKATHEWCNIWSVAEFEHTGLSRDQAVLANKNNFEYVKGIEVNFKEILDKVGDLHLLGATDKENLQAQGAKVIAFTAADQSDNDES